MGQRHRRCQCPGARRSSMPRPSSSPPHPSWLHPSSPDTPLNLESTAPISSMSAVPALAETLDSPPCEAAGGGIRELSTRVQGRRYLTIHPLPMGNRPGVAPAGRGYCLRVGSAVWPARWRWRTAKACSTCASAARCGWLAGDCARRRRALPAVGRAVSTAAATARRKTE